MLKRNYISVIHTFEPRGKINVQKYLLRFQNKQNNTYRNH